MLAAKVTSLKKQAHKNELRSEVREVVRLQFSIFFRGIAFVRGIAVETTVKANTHVRYLSSIFSKIIWNKV